MLATSRLAFGRGVGRSSVVASWLLGVITAAFTA
jgi:hypothetical protein